MIVPRPEQILAGDVDEVLRRLMMLIEETGGFGTLLAMGHEWEPRQDWQHSMELLANEVMPQLADLAGLGRPESGGPTRCRLPSPPPLHS